MGTVRALSEPVLAPVAGGTSVFARVSKYSPPTYNQPQELLSEFDVGTDFLLEGGENTLRLAYSGVTVDQIEEGVRRLAEAYRAVAPTTA